MTTENQPRYTIVVGKIAQSRLSSIAKQFKISQGAAMEVLIENADVPQLEDAFKARREAKIAKRTTKADLLNQLRSLTPEQQAYLEKLASR